MSHYPDTQAACQINLRISGFRQMHAYAAEHAPLRRNVTIEDVGNAAAFLCSPLASGVTGEVLYVDAGYHLLG